MGVHILGRYLNCQAMFIRTIKCDDQLSDVPTLLITVPELSVKYYTNSLEVKKGTKLSVRYLDGANQPGIRLKVSKNSPTIIRQLVCLVRNKDILVVGVIIQFRVFTNIQEHLVSKLCWLCVVLGHFQQHYEGCSINSV